MIDFFRNLFRSEKPDFAKLIKEGALIIDVRTAAEYAGGHIKGSSNIPLGDLSRQTVKLNKDKPLILCCASGIRSSTACRTLRSKGFTRIYNGGSWIALRRYEQ
jgi:phage shock protein E